MPYDHFEHRHRFAEWSAARAAQRGCASVEVFKHALDASKIKKVLKAEKLVDIDAEKFREQHKIWCNDALTDLHKRGAKNPTYGRAAKLIAVYLKSMVVLGPERVGSLASVAHPPIDSEVLSGFAQRSDLPLQLQRRFRATTWTTLNEADYYSIIDDIRGVLGNNVPFWMAEEHWSSPTHLGCLS